MEDLKRLVKKMRERRQSGKEPDEEEKQLRLRLQSHRKELNASGDAIGSVVCKALLIDAPEKKKSDWVSRIKKKCRTCGGPAQLQCSVCKVSTYCSTECQLKHWPEHKKRCYKYDYDPNFKMFDDDDEKVVEEEEKKA